MTTIRTVIVDDEPLARDKLRGFLARHPALELVGEAGDGSEAVRVIDAANPDLLLLDIQMPELDGFEVLAAVSQEPLPYVIFVTAFDHYAVQAFERGALDYLLKPVASAIGSTWQSSGLGISSIADVPRIWRSGSTGRWSRPAPARAWSAFSSRKGTAPGWCRFRRSSGSKRRAIISSCMAKMPSTWSAAR